MYVKNKILMYDDANYGVYYYRIELFFKIRWQNTSIINIINTVQIHKRKQTNKKKHDDLFTKLNVKQFCSDPKLLKEMGEYSRCSQQNVNN